MCSIILENVTCENTACKLNLNGSCQRIGTMIYFNQNRIPSGFYTCDKPVYDGKIEPYYGY